ncbi:MAG: DNA adenine methylase [Pseudomonadota bacterium]
MTIELESPFSYFGGKRKAAAEVWARLGAVRNYVEPFFGSGAVLFRRPEPIDGTETINDADGMVSNFWRAIKLSPSKTAEHADWPVNENDLHARHAWLVQQKDSLREQLEGDPDWHDPKIAGWWNWGLCCWIGGGFCSGVGPWQVVHRKLVHLGDARGVNRKLVHLGDAGQGVNRKRVHDRLLPWFQALSDRLRHVRVCSGDWSRVCGPSVTTGRGLTGVFLDPPYADTANRRDGLYSVDSLSVAHAVRNWAVAHGDDPLLRIALCGYEGEHEMPASWSTWQWDAGVGYGRSGNGKRERIWFSPHCLGSTQLGLFG